MRICVLASGSKGNSTYVETDKHKILYIDNKSGKPLKMEIKDNNKNIAVYILYKEVIVNS